MSATNPPATNPPVTDWPGKGRRSPGAAPQVRRSAGERRPGWDRVVIALIALFGVLVACYPMAASWFSALAQLNAQKSYSHTVTQMSPDEQAAVLRAAEEYNAQLSGGLIIDPFSNVSTVTGPLDEPAQEYLRQLAANPDGVMSSLTIPVLDASFPVFHGATEETLRKGVGHLYGSSLPVGGSGTHAVLTAHAGLPEAELFTHLNRMRAGDDFWVDTYGRSMHYRVSGVETVDPNDLAQLGPQPGRDMVTLVTCAPVGVNNYRLLVHAERVPDDPGVATQTPQVSGIGFPWWALAIAAALAIVARSIVRVVLARRQRDDDEMAEDSMPSANMSPEDSGTIPPDRRDGPRHRRARE